LNIQADIVNNFSPSVRLAQSGRLKFQHAGSLLNSVPG
jgi:hypothetical protein